MDLNAYFWENKYLDDKTGWDIGHISPPLKAYIDQLEDKDLNILIPGAGNSYEGEFLHNQGFKNLWLCDVAPSAFRNFHSRVPSFPEDHLISNDFFELKGQYDLIIEQTFFCALNPALRANYVEQMHQLLRPGGKLVGLLFDAELNTDQPPFGGSKKEYSALFGKHFSQINMEECYNSITPRKGREIFIQIKK